MSILGINANTQEDKEKNANSRNNLTPNLIKIKEKITGSVCVCLFLVLFLTSFGWIRLGKQQNAIQSKTPDKWVGAI